MWSNRKMLRIVWHDRSGTVQTRLLVNRIRKMTGYHHWSHNDNEKGRLRNLMAEDRLCPNCRQKKMEHIINAKRIEQRRTV